MYKWDVSVVAESVHELTWDRPAKLREYEYTTEIFNFL